MPPPPQPCMACAANTTARPASSNRQLQRSSLIRRLQPGERQVKREHSLDMVAPSVIYDGHRLLVPTTEGAFVARRGGRPTDRGGYGRRIRLARSTVNRYAR